MSGSVAAFLILIVSQGVVCNIMMVNKEGGGGASMEDSFRQCLLSSPSGTLGYCLGVGALGKLQSLDSHPEFDLIDGLTASRDPSNKEYRETQRLNFAERDPADFRSLVDSVGDVFSHRNLHWDMGFLYPGLAMRVVTSASPAGTLEFTMDPHRELLNKQHAFKEIGTGRLLARQFLLPMLLGFKLNLATLIPVIFGLLALLAKKAIILSKIALIISSAYGLGTLLLGSSFNGGGGGFPQQQQQHHYTSSLNPGFGHQHYNRLPDEDAYHQDLVYRGISGNGNTDQLNLYENLQAAPDFEMRQDKSDKGRNFAWSSVEKDS